MLEDRHDEDPEVAAMKVIAGAMRQLDEFELDAAAKQRVLAWMISRYGPNGSSVEPARREAYEEGQELELALSGPGRKPGQAKGNLDDGTLVIVDDAEHLVGDKARVIVKKVRSTTRGVMVFARLPRPERMDSFSF